MQRECQELSAFNCRKQSVCHKGGEWCLHLQPANSSNSFTWRNKADDNSESHKDMEPKEGHIFKTSKKHCLRKQQGFLTQGMWEYPPLCIQALLHHKKEARKNRKAYADPEHLPCLYAYFFPKIRIWTFTQPLHPEFLWTSSKKICLKIFRTKSSDLWKHQGFSNKLPRPYTKLMRNMPTTTSYHLCSNTWFIFCISWHQHPAFTQVISGS